MKRPFRFGVATDGATSHQEWINKARQTEDLGYSTLLIPDHFVTRFSPVPALLAAADATRKLRIGSFVFDNDFRHPAVLAKDVATLDVLSGGRFELGIGAGWMPEEYEQTGIPLDPAGLRITRLEEAIHILKGLFADDPFTFSGKYYSIKNLEGLPKPTQRPHPPLFIGGGGKRLLSLAAREANIIGVHLKVGANGQASPVERSPEVLAQKIEWIRQAAGERFDALELNILTSIVLVTDKPRQAVEELINKSKHITLTVDQMLETPYALIGSLSQIVEHIQMLRENYGISYIVVNDQYKETLAPVVARLAGQ